MFEYFKHYIGIGKREDSLPPPSLHKNKLLSQDESNECINYQPEETQKTQKNSLVDM